VSRSQEDRSYRALLDVPSLGRILISMLLGRVAGAMLSVALVLFALSEYDSPALAGFVTFCVVFPGLVASPIVGALLDRYGRVRLITVDYFVAAMAMLFIGFLGSIHALPAWLLVAITFVLGVTSMFSDSGLRTLFPTIVPQHLWERVNAADSNGYLLATIIGPPVAATLVAIVGGPGTFAVMAAPFAIAGLALVRVRGPVALGASSDGLFKDAVVGLRYVWTNRTLRGLGVSASVASISFGIGTIVVPIIILDRLGAPKPVVGLAFAVSGIVGVATAFLFGRVDTNGREWVLLIVAMTGLAGAAALLYPAAASLATLRGELWIVASMAVLGFSLGLWDIALFTVRQRRTDPRLMGRAFAISMAFNSCGFPIGAAISGWLATRSLELAITVAVMSAVAGTLLAALMVPRTGSSGPQDAAVSK
jgi:MFS family permease